ncbi:MAG: hypothetical protein BAJALOKI1v1_600002 [Promethearchaeota archaeon]|nr:MAG: hypothetical protein BAJALOKI1v1_600002 [Candidatus Lokiarchaeota archaeon]
MVKKKILLISPRNQNYAKKLFPPLSLTNIAAYIPEKYDIQIIDENLEKIQFDADLVAVTVNTCTARRAYEIANEWTQLKIPVILGGIHPTVLPSEAEKYSTSVVIGESEEIWTSLLNDFEKDALKKRYHASLFNFKKTNVRLPRRDFLKKRYIFESLETVRGCPFNCHFCSVTRFYGGRYRFKPLKMIEKEIESMNKKSLFIVDDNLIGFGSIAEKRTLELLNLLKEYDLTWMGQASVNVAENEEILRLANESGCMFLFLGFESINHGFLSTFNKQINLRRGVASYKNTINTLHDYNINVMGSFIIGSDFDSPQSLSLLEDFIINSDIDIPNLTILTPYPGTKLYETLLAQNRLFNPQWWLENPLPLFTFKPKNLTVQHLAHLYYKFINNLNGLQRSLKRLIKSLITNHSLKKAMFSLTENIINGNNYKRMIRENVKKR